MASLFEEAKDLEKRLSETRKKMAISERGINVSFSEDGKLSIWRPINGGADECIRVTEYQAKAVIKMLQTVFEDKGESPK